MKTNLDTSNYDNVIVIDSQVVLEARPLGQLPWKELFEGSILLLIVRQVLTEIDGKKNDGRLGKRARAFNKLLDEFIENREPSSVITEPKIDVAAVDNRTIDWAALDGLERDNGDDCIVAQSLNALVDRPDELVLLSHDMRPREAAKTYGMKAVRLPESWLKEPELSPHDKRLRELEAKLKVLEADQPQLKVEIETIIPEPWIYHEVASPSAEQVDAILRKELAHAPQQSRRGPFDIGLDYDHSHKSRLATWEENMRQDIPLMHKGLTKLYSQYRIRVKVENVGPISAENFSIEIRSGNAVLHSVPYFVLVTGPIPPHPRPFYMHTPALNAKEFQLSRREPFRFYWDERGPGKQVIQSCASFRQDKKHVVELSVELRSGTSPKAQIQAIATASNMKGDVQEQKIVDVSSVAVPFDDLFDAVERKIKIRPSVDLPEEPELGDITWFRNDGTEYEAD
jgi:hypothetical protein